MYLDLTTFIDTENLDQYENNGFISQSTSKEERAQNVQTPILGNVKVFFNDNPSIPMPNDVRQQAPQHQQQAAPQQQAPAVPTSDQWDDDIPFAPIGLAYDNLFLHCI